MKVILIGVLMLIGILCIQAIFSIPDETIITEEDNDSFIGIATGDILILKLETNLGTGYAWHIVANDSFLLKLSGESKVEPMEEDAKKEEAPTVGQPERMVFRFKAQRSGTNILRMSYFRIHEKEKEKPLKIFKINVQIY